MNRGLGFDLHSFFDYKDPLHEQLPRLDRFGAVREDYTSPRGKKPRWRNVRRNEEDQIIEDRQYVNGLLHGKSTWYHDNGRIHIEGYYKEGKPQGEWVRYNKDGERMQKANYDGGRLNGECTWWGMTGTKVTQRRVYSKQSIQFQELIKYYGNGDPSTEKYVETEGDELLLVWLEYYENGQIKHDVTYRLIDGDYHNDGECFWFHENGQLETKNTFVEGKAKYEWIFFNADGTRRTPVEYSAIVPVFGGSLNGQDEGFRLIYEQESVYRLHPITKEWVYFNDSMYCGPVFTLHRNGQTWVEGLLNVNGNIDGRWVQYDEAGSIQIELFYRDGERIR